LTQPIGTLVSVPRIIEDEPVRHERELAELKAAMLKRANWPLDQARDLLRQGYTLAHTIKRTGWTSTELLFDDSGEVTYHED
jgi:hypothetical protein